MDRARVVTGLYLTERRRVELFETYDLAETVARINGSTTVVDAGEWFAAVPNELPRRDAEREVDRLVLGRRYRGRP
jgi:hypothetical protein